MKVNRQEFLSVLNTVICGAHRQEVLEQSHCFIFREGLVTSFNGEILATAKLKDSPGDFAVPAHDLTNLISKFPDEEIELTIKGNELIVAGKKRRSGLTIQNEILLPIEDIPVPDKMSGIKEGVMSALSMAAKVCSASNEDYRVSHIQIAPDKIQATDKLRFLRVTVDTGLKTILVPAGPINAIESISITSATLLKGWLWLGNKDVKIGICCTEEEYYEDALIDSVINMPKANVVQLPKEMPKVLDRALIMSKDDCNRMSKIKLTAKSITVRTQKESGWYEERQPVKYKGQDMELFVGLSLFKDLLNKTNKAYVSQEKMKMKKDNVEFLVCLGE